MIDRAPSNQPAQAIRETLFGRERERATLVDALETMLSGTGGLVLISGDAGIGKTSLSRELARMAAERGAAVRTGASYDLSVTPPYGAWSEILEGNSDESTHHLLPPVSHGPDWERASSLDAFFGGIVDHLLNVASRTPLVLVFEDLHWADVASIELLRFVARRLGSARVLIVATYRDMEVDRNHLLHQFLPVLVRESNATRIRLRPLDEDSIFELIDARYELSPGDRTRVVDYLESRTEGNPFFIEETLRTLEEREVVYRDQEQWCVGDLERIPIPPLVQQVIDGRLARLDPKCRDLLAIASVIGAEIPLETWRTFGNANEEQLASGVERFVELGLLEETGNGTSLRFTHALVREALYSSLALPRRQTLHRDIGHALARQSGIEPDAVAYHLSQAGHADAFQWLLAAGARAQELYAWRTAAERFEEAQLNLERGEARDLALGWLHYRIGLLLAYADPARAIEHLRDAERIALEVDDPHLAAFASADRGLTRCLTGNVRRGLAEMNAGVSALDRLPDINSDDYRTTNPAVAEIQRGAFALVGTAGGVNIRKGALVFWLSWTGCYQDALDIGRRYVEEIDIRTTGVEDSLGDALAGLGHAYAALGDPERALNCFAQARDTFARIDHHFKVGNTAIYELSEAMLPYRADRIMQREWLADQAEAG